MIDSSNNFNSASTSKRFIVGSFLSLRWWWGLSLALLCCLRSFLSFLGYVFKSIRYISCSLTASVVSALLKDNLPCINNPIYFIGAISLPPNRGFGESIRTLSPLRYHVIKLYGDGGDCDALWIGNKPEST